MPSTKNNIERKDSPFEFKFSNDSSEGTFEGHAAVFDNLDDVGDVMMKGAFSNTLSTHAKNGTMPVMFLNHAGMGGFMGPRPEDLIPIGTWQKMSEDSKGLQCKGQLCDLDTETGKRIYRAMKDGRVKGLSIMYKAVDYTLGVKADEPSRTLHSVDLFEAGPVTFPVNREATISSVKGLFNTEREFEKFLQEAGFSRSQRLVIMYEGAKALFAKREAGGIKSLLEDLRAASKSFDPNQPRDERGRFASTGGGGGSSGGGSGGRHSSGGGSFRSTPKRQMTRTRVLKVAEKHARRAIARILSDLINKRY